MKKLLLLLFFIPVFAFSQSNPTGTLTTATDTIIKYRNTGYNVANSLMLKVDTIAGTLDAIVEIVVADDYSVTGLPSVTSAIPDSLFVRYDPGLVDTLTQTGVYGFRWNNLPFDYVGLKITINNVSGIYARHKLIGK